MLNVRRGEVWLADLDPVQGHEQAGRRPVVVLSDDAFHTSGSMLAVVVPLTRRKRGIRYHVEAAAPDGGLRADSVAMCEQIRVIAHERFVEKWGEMSKEVMSEIELQIILLLRLEESLTDSQSDIVIQEALIS